MKNIAIIEAPSNLGLIEPFPGKHPGTGKLPGWLKKHGFHDEIVPKHVIQIKPPDYAMDYDEETGVRNTDKIAIFSRLLAQDVNRTIASDLFPVVLGGDCSILIGCTLGIKKLGRYGLFFIDGHTDYVLPLSSYTKGAAGMDLAIVTGNGHNRLTNIEGCRPYIMEEDAFAFGNRDLEDANYVDQIERSSVNYFDLNRIRSAGIENITASSLEKINLQTKGFWIHLDVDVLDHNMMPCVDSPQPGGLSYDELTQVLRMLLASGSAVGMDITILDPDLDPDGTYTKEFIKQISAVFNTYRLPVS